MSFYRCESTRETKRCTLVAIKTPAKAKTVVGRREKKSLRGDPMADPSYDYIRNER